MKFISIVCFLIFINTVTSQTENQISSNCSTPNNESGICISLQKCDELLTLIQKIPLSNVTRSFLRRSHCGYENSHVKVCCKIPQTVKTEKECLIQNSTNCLTPKNEEGSCILFEECDELVTLIKQTPLTEENRKFLVDSRCGYRNGKLLICCKKQQPIESEVSNFGICLTPIDSNGQCVYLEDCKQLYNLIQKKTLKANDKRYLQESACGQYKGRNLVCCPSEMLEVRNPVNINLENLLPKPDKCGYILSNRIVGGNETTIDEYPWLALLEYKKPNNSRGFHCGGSLISNRYVLTASHCVTEQNLPANWELTGVRLGEWDLSTENDCQRDGSGSIDCADPYIDIAIERIVPHEHYIPGTKNNYNDIALLRLTRSIEFTDFIQPICLPRSAQLKNANFNGVKLNIAGWGRTYTQKQSNIKLKATISVVKLEECQKVYEPHNIRLIDSQLCAGGSLGVDSCKGDSGGPLIGLDNSTDLVNHVLIGIVSFGSRMCGMLGWPGIYTRVGAYVDWIETNLQP